MTLADQIKDLSIRINQHMLIDNFPSFHEEFITLQAEYRNGDSGLKESILNICQENLPDNDLPRIYWYSFMLELNRDSDIEKQYYDLILTGQFTPIQKSFFYWQATMLGYKTIDLRKLYCHILELCRSQVEFRSGVISPKDRQKDCIVVFAMQLLGINHAPSRRVTDYIDSLKRLGKKVVLFNTADISRYSQLPTFNERNANYLEEYNQGNYMDGIPFRQTRVAMPDFVEIQHILDNVHKLRPEFVLSVGHSNITADLCSEYVTTVTIPTSSGIPVAGSNLFVNYNKLNKEDRGIIDSLDLDENQVIESWYTYKSPVSEKVLTRAQICLPEDKYLISVVGNRLASEITELFANALVELVSSNPDIHIVFAGKFIDYSDFVEKYPELKSSSTDVGYQDDILAFYKCCDAYLNPYRLGGGSSAAQALLAGIPVLTEGYGDVAGAVGPAFCFSSLDKMKVFINKNISDARHKAYWSKKAKNRARKIFDTDSMISHVVKQVSLKLDMVKRVHIN